MKLLTLICVFALTAFAEDWQKTLTPAPGKFPKLRPLAVHYQFGWSGVKAAEAEAKFSSGKGLNQLDLTASTKGLGRTLWRMDSTATSTCDSATLRPIALKQVEVYSSKTMTTSVAFKPEGPERMRVPNPPDKTPPKPKRFKLPSVYDQQGALLFLRSQPLKNGDVVRMCVFPGNTPYFAEIGVEGREKLKAGGKEWDAIRCSLKLREVKKDLSLGVHKKFKNATAWLSDDRDRLLLKIDAEVFIGSVWVELDRVDFPAGR